MSSRSAKDAPCPEASNLVVSDAPDRADYQIILRALADFEEAAVGPLHITPLAILIKGEAGETVGGLWGRSLFRWLMVELLFVPENMRRRGIGELIMARAEAIAKERGCVGMWLDTYDFQAPDFYRRLGFEPFGQVQDMPPGHRRIFMQKRWG